MCQLTCNIYIHLGQATVYFNPELKSWFPVASWFLHIFRFRQHRCSQLTYPKKLMTRTVSSRSSHWIVRETMVTSFCASFEMKLKPCRMPKTMPNVQKQSRLLIFVDGFWMAFISRKVEGNCWPRFFGSVLFSLTVTLISRIHVRKKALDGLIRNHCVNCCYLSYPCLHFLCII